MEQKFLLTVVVEALVGLEAEFGRAIAPTAKG